MPAMRFGIGRLQLQCLHGVEILEEWTCLIRVLNSDYLRC